MSPTAIEWTDETWNPVTGCTKVSPGCDHCYAERITNRFGGPGAFDTVVLHPDRLEQPLHWRKPRMVFTCSMADLFHDDVPDEYIARVFAVMAATPWHTYQVLTKRHGRVASLLRTREQGFAFPALVRSFVQDDWNAPLATDPLGMAGWPLRNVWLGVSLEDQKWAEVRIPKLLEAPAAVHFLSVEPLLGPVNLEAYLAPVPEDPDGAPYPGSIGWVIVGGESGPDARPMHPEWARSLRDQCVAAGVPFFFKQWGEWAPQTTGGVLPLDLVMSPDGDTYEVDASYICAPNESEGEWLRRIGKHAAGRDLDGRTWDEMPERVVA